MSTDATRRFATYTNLDPGTYTFQVKAANKDGVWGAADASLEVTILPPWWKTMFYASIVFAVGYMLHYHVFMTGALQTEEYETEMEQAEEEAAEMAAR